MSQKRDRLRMLRTEANVSVKMAANALWLNRSSWYYHTKPTEKKRSHRALDPRLLRQLKGLSLDTVGIRLYREGQRRRPGSVLFLCTLL